MEININIHAPLEEEKKEPPKYQQQLPTSSPLLKAMGSFKYPSLPLIQMKAGSISKTAKNLYMQQNKSPEHQKSLERTTSIAVVINKPKQQSEDTSDNKSFISDHLSEKKLSLLQSPGKLLASTQKRRRTLLGNSQIKMDFLLPDSVPPMPTIKQTAEEKRKSRWNKIKSAEENKLQSKEKSPSQKSSSANSQLEQAMGNEDDEFGFKKSPQIRARERVIKAEKQILKEKEKARKLSEHGPSPSDKSMASGVIIKRMRNHANYDKSHESPPGSLSSSMNTTGLGGRLRRGSIQAPTPIGVQVTTNPPSPQLESGHAIAPESNKYFVAPENTVDNKVKNARIMKRIFADHLQKRQSKKYMKYNTLLQDQQVFKDQKTGYKSDHTRKDVLAATKTMKSQMSKASEGAAEFNIQMQKGDLQNEEEDYELEEQAEEMAIFRIYQAMNNQSPSKFVFDPDGVFKTGWEIIILICATWQAISVPFKLSFYSGIQDNDVVDQITDIFFFIDIILTFNTGFYNNGILIMNRRWIILEYLKYGFILDTLSTFPYTYIISWMDKTLSEVENDFTTLTIIKVMRFMRFLKLLRVLKIHKLKTKYEELYDSDKLNMYTLFIQIFVLVFFFAHMFACFFWLVSKTAMDDYDEKLSWIKVYGIVDSSIAEQYINCLYWAFLTMITIGYGDISALNTPERLYVMFAMLIMAGVYAFTLSKIGQAVREYNRLYDTFRENMLFVRQWMNFHNLQFGLRNNIIGYLEYQWNQRLKQKIESKELMVLLNQELKEQIVMHINGQQLKNLTFLNEFKDMEFCSQLVFVMKPQNFGVGEDIIIEKEEGDKIFFIVSGRVAVLHKKTHTYLVDLEKDDYFGEISFFSEKPRMASVKSRDFTNTITLDRQSYFDVGEDYDESLSIFYKIKYAITEHKDYTYLKVKCFICKRKGHISVHCPKFKSERGNLNKSFKRPKRRTSRGDALQTVHELDETEENKYPLYGSDGESQLYNSEKTEISQPSNYLKHFYSQVGISIESEEGETSEEQQNSIVTETQQSLQSEESRMSLRKAEVAMELSKLRDLETQNRLEESMEEEKKNIHEKPKRFDTVPMIKIEDFDIAQSAQRLVTGYTMLKNDKTIEMLIDQGKRFSLQPKSMMEQSSSTDSLISESISECTPSEGGKGKDPKRDNLNYSNKAQADSSFKLERTVTLGKSSAYNDLVFQLSIIPVCTTNQSAMEDDKNQRITTMKLPSGDASHESQQEILESESSDENNLNRQQMAENRFGNNPHQQHLLHNIHSFQEVEEESKQLIHPSPSLDQHVLSIIEKSAERLSFEFNAPDRQDYESDKETLGFDGTPFQGFGSRQNSLQTGTIGSPRFQDQIQNMPTQSPIVNIIEIENPFIQVPSFMDPPNLNNPSPVVMNESVFESTEEIKILSEGKRKSRSFKKKMKREDIPQQDCYKQVSFQSRQVIDNMAFTEQSSMPPLRQQYQELQKSEEGFHVQEFEMDEALENEMIREFEKQTVQQQLQFKRRRKKDESLGQMM